MIATSHFRKRFFGRRQLVLTDGSELAQPSVSMSLSGDLKLFATTFAGGFLFMAVYLA